MHDLFFHGAHEQVCLIIKQSVLEGSEIQAGSNKMRFNVKRAS